MLHCRRRCADARFRLEVDHPARPLFMFSDGQPRSCSGHDMSWFSEQTDEYLHKSESVKTALPRCSSVLLFVAENRKLERRHQSKIVTEAPHAGSELTNLIKSRASYRDEPRLSFLRVETGTKNKSLLYQPEAICKWVRIVMSARLC